MLFREHYVSANHTHMIIKHSKLTANLSQRHTKVLCRSTFYPSRAGTSKCAGRHPRRTYCESLMASSIIVPELTVMMCSEDMNARRTPVGGDWLPHARNMSTGLKGGNGNAAMAWRSSRCRVPVQKKKGSQWDKRRNKYYK